MLNFLTTSDTTYNTHPDILLTHGQTTALLPIYDHNKICSYTYRNLARTPIEVSSTRNPSTLPPGSSIFPMSTIGLLLSEKSRTIQFVSEFVNLRSKGKRFSFTNIIVERTFMIQFWHIHMHKQLLLSLQLRSIQSTPI